MHRAPERENEMASALAETANVTMAADKTTRFGLQLRAASFLNRVTSLEQQPAAFKSAKIMDNELQTFLIDVINRQHADPGRHYCGVLAIIFR